MCGRYVRYVQYPWCLPCLCLCLWRVFFFFVSEEQHLLMPDYRMMAHRCWHTVVDNVSADVAALLCSTHIFFFIFQVNNKYRNPFFFKSWHFPRLENKEAISTNCVKDINSLKRTWLNGLYRNSHSCRDNKGTHWNDLDSLTNKNKSRGTRRGGLGALGFKGTRHVMPSM